MMYRALKISIQVFKLLAVLSFGSGILGLALSFINRPQQVGLGIIALIGGIVGAVILAGISDLFEAVKSTEESSRQTLAILKKLKSK